MDSRIPYYMAYPMPLLYDDEKMERRDYEYMKGMYPKAAKALLPYIEEECERMEYDRSMIYDEYPDRLQLHLMCARVYKKVIDTDAFPDEEWVRELITVMLYQELYKRRCDHRKYKRKYY